jgi:hypothetical protein
MKSAILNVVLVTLQIVKVLKTHTEKEYSPFLDQSVLKKILYGHLLVQSEKPLLEKLKNHQHVLNKTQVTQQLLRNAFLISAHALRQVEKELELD